MSAVLGSGGRASSGADRGRAAVSPREIPARGWADVLSRVKVSLKDDQVSLMAAGVAFFSLLALVPALAALVALYGLLRSPAEVQADIASLASVLPADAQGVLDDQLTSLTSSSSAGLGLGLVVSVLLSLWAASGGVSQLISAVNVAYDEEDSRGFVKRRGLALLLTLGAIVMVLVTFSLVAVLPAVLSVVGLDGVAGTVVGLLRWPLLGLLMVVALAVLYRVAPDREDARWRWVSWGSVVAVGLWLLGSVLFSVYVSRFSSYNETYGSLGAVVVLLLWLYLSSFIVLLGAELNVELEKQTVRDSTTGSERPLGQRSAEGADVVGSPRPGASGA